MAELKLSDALALARRERDAKRWRQLETLSRAILSARPTHDEAMFLLAGALQAQGRHDDAMACYHQVLRDHRDDARSHNNAANGLKEAGAYEEALAAYRRAIELRPDYALAHNNLGVALFDRDDFETAEACFLRALELQPERIDTHKNLASVLEETHRFEQARRAYETALALGPDDARLHWNHAQLLLLMGEMESGWAEYEWRWRYEGFPGPRFRFARPALANLEVQDRTILVHAEQGIGDTFQFIRYTHCLKQRGARVVAALPAVLHRILATVPGIDRITERVDAMPDYHAHVALLSLPRLLGTTVSTIPADVPYIRAEAERAQRWRDRLSDLNGLKVGLAWRGNPAHPKDADRSIPLEQLASVLQLPGIRFVSLQKGLPKAEIANGGLGPQILNLGDELDAGPDAFVDTAAVIENLDLVISIDSAIAHLAGAMGRETWTLLKHVPDWRWMLDREDSPWYPTMRLFRQPTRGAWEPVIEQLAAELRALHGA